MREQRQPLLTRAWAMEDDVFNSPFSGSLESTLCSGVRSGRRLAVVKMVEAGRRRSATPAPYRTSNRGCSTLISHSADPRRCPSPRRRR